jgi:hypothetical protein
MPRKWFIAAFALVHFLATLGCFFLLFYVGQYSVDAGTDLPRWWNLSGIAAVLLSLPIVYPMLVLKVLTPQVGLGLWALVLACAANSLLVGIVVGYSRSHIVSAFRRLPRQMHGG